MALRQSQLKIPWQVQMDHLSEKDHIWAPVSMNISMHMFGMMYAPTDYFIFLIMINYQQKELTQQRMEMS